MTKQANKIPKVLLVDDDDTVATGLEEYRREFGLAIEFQSAPDAGMAVDILNETCFDAAVLDVRLPGVTGVSLGDLIRERDVNIPLAYLTNLDTPTVRVEAVNHRATLLVKSDYFLCSEGLEVGMKRLLTIIGEIAKLNPCLDGGVRIDNHGFPRQLPTTPIELPNVLKILLGHSRALAAAA